MAYLPCRICRSAVILACCATTIGRHGVGHAHGRMIVSVSGGQCASLGAEWPATCDMFIVASLDGCGIRTAHAVDDRADSDLLIAHAHPFPSIDIAHILCHASQCGRVCITAGRRELCRTRLPCAPVVATMRAHIFVATQRPAVAAPLTAADRSDILADWLAVTSVFGASLL
ncbi:hypothetical protein THASP1DRAFT_21600 [Thamnocephalis sphaerospora]|uniref:Uncharacterized protein n=1 Tax=Thamnocephalis sphaerospora TaxID=78915 RepID=A0A4V1IXE0_9FUNG|nr:hypothetical protein THASP1DRAFT_21600 [Thamnocephalis sphaerospora]|eukprot:RKP10729.1 hypothetical protein THASP1DRAFT_21600 [Thamnocephalis sphaerospora]